MEKTSEKNTWIIGNKQEKSRKDRESTIKETRDENTRQSKKRKRR